MLHIRTMLQNESTLCGADPHEGSQSVLGMRIQKLSLIYSAPNESDYCPECWKILEQAALAFDAFCM